MQPRNLHQTLQPVVPASPVRPVHGPAILGLVLAVLAFGLAGCGSLVSMATRPMVANLSTAIQKERDVELVRLGAPSYMLLMEGFLEGSPEDDDLLAAASKLYAAYAAAFAQEGSEQALLMSRKAHDYAIRAISLRNDTFAQLHDHSAVEFEPVPATFDSGDEDDLLLLINAWAVYIIHRKGDWDLVAELPKVQQLAERLVELDEGYGHGAAHMILGVLKTILPASLGGKPEEARMHFERAIELSGGANLQAKVYFASRYARLLYDRELHDRLLNEVLETPVDQIPELTLSNTLARQEAARLLEQADDFF